MFLHTIRISHALFFGLVIWSAIAFNATERLKSIHPFTTKRTGKLADKLDLASTAYQLRRLNSLQGNTSSAQKQIRNLNYSILSSERSTVTGAATSSSSSRPSAVKPNPVLTRRSVGGSSAFHRVRGWLVLGVVVTGIIFLLVTHVPREHPPNRCNTYCRMIC